MIDASRRLALKLFGLGTSFTRLDWADKDDKTEAATTTKTADQSGLPSPGWVLKHAKIEGNRTQKQLEKSERSLNLVLSEFPDNPDVEYDGTKYTGEDAGVVGRLAAAVEATDQNVFLHYPEIIKEVKGPWLVLEPLGGQIATVHKGQAQATVTMHHRQPSSNTHAGFQDCLTLVRRAADASHLFYPADRTVFSTGLTTFILAEVEDCPTTLRATFDVSTIPTTNKESVTDQFKSIDCIKEVEFKSSVDFEKSTPSKPFRGAVENAHSDVLESVSYEWFPRPTLFSTLNTNEKIACGIDKRGATTFTAKEYTQMKNILSSITHKMGDQT
ncbi:hypothetical protein [Halomicrococcus sp. NG-SE-24]|uniref:hypothetical protein n=1 Tax=Halomicrococcus sp. NG-SE-24 TaxID=3436928 RepID=UPI003D9994C4